MANGVQDIILVDVNRADFRGVVLHEFGHTLGFGHEMDRPDFPRKPGTSCDGVNATGNSLGTPPDVQSVMAATGYCTFNTDLDYFDWSGERAAYGRPSHYPLPFNADTVAPYAGPDWSFGRFKAHCALGDPLTGLSALPGTAQAHAALCGSFGADNLAGLIDSTVAASTIAFDTTSSWRGGTDWDPGFFKGECSANKVTTGVSQTTDGKLTAIRCMPLKSPRTEGTCYTRTFATANAGWQGDDWDPNFFKGQCATGDHVIGVSRSVSSGAAHSIKCCHVN